MTTKIDIPKEILETAVGLRNTSREIYLALFSYGKPATAEVISKLVGHTRAYVNMRLCQLEDSGKIKSTQVGKTKEYYIAKEGLPSA